MCVQIVRGVRLMRDAHVCRECIPHLLDEDRHMVQEIQFTHMIGLPTYRLQSFRCRRIFYGYMWYRIVQVSFSGRGCGLSLPALSFCVTYLIGDLRWSSTISMQRSTPRCLMVLVEELLAFETSPEPEYDGAVVYFASLGGYTPKEAVSSSFKAAITDACANEHTWLGASGNKSLASARIMRAIYEATLRNRSFPRPVEREFEKLAQNALKSAKERHRKQLTALGHHIPSTATTEATMAVNDRRNCWRNTAISGNNDATASS
ncbi:uncharacterized protein LOC143213856 [Lasioglossum baleicum]|uniref:uncharacterized protein LOC143213856 n=1 Tax=Lasioglossum baleicum TaxID=434251 RepID=UPI003FCCBAEF